MPTLEPEPTGVNTPPTSAHVHDWRTDSDAFMSWRDCLACGKREWLMEVDLP